MEVAGDYAGCLRVLIGTLEKHAIPQAQARRRAQALWSDPPWPREGIKVVHIQLRQALMACGRQHVVKVDHDVVLRDLDLIPRERALYLEHLLMVPQPHV